MPNIIPVHLAGGDCGSYHWTGPPRTNPTWLEFILFFWTALLLSPDVVRHASKPGMTANIAAFKHLLLVCKPDLTTLPLAIWALLVVGAPSGIGRRGGSRGFLLGRLVGPLDFAYDGLSCWFRSRW